MEEMSFKLSKPLTVSVDGQFEQSYELTLRAPSMKDRKQIAKVVQFISRAKSSQEQRLLKSIDLSKLKDLQGSDEIDIDDDAAKSATRDLILSSEDDLEDFYKAFDTIACRVCEVLDGVKIKLSHIEEMDVKDYDKLCFEYVANFIE